MCGEGANAFYGTNFAASQRIPVYKVTLFDELFCDLDNFYLLQPFSSIMLYMGNINVKFLYLRSPRYLSIKIFVRS